MAYEDEQELVAGDEIFLVAGEDDVPDYDAELYIPGNPDRTERYVCPVCGSLEVVLVWDTGLKVDGVPWRGIAEIPVQNLMSQTGRIDKELVDVDPRMCTECSQYDEEEDD